MWIARDKCGALYLYYSKPEKVEDDGCWSDHTCDNMYLGMHKYPEVQWSDAEATEVEISITDIKKANTIATTNFLMSIVLLFVALILGLYAAESYKAVTVVLSIIFASAGGYFYSNSKSRLTR